jgi:hypothetical protein
MLSLRAALVPYDKGGTAHPEELMRVAAALQTQLIRDVGPIWDVTGVVAPFFKLEEVPPGYMPVVVADETLPAGSHGFHFIPRGEPLAVVQYVPGWSLAASHELIEMLCDPYGARTVVGPSLADKKLEALTRAQVPDPADEVVDGEGGYQPQGDVEFLLEVCDPVEHSHYEIDGITVSDFVTPHFYQTLRPGRASYSFMGHIEKPWQLLMGGYISWRVPAQGGAVYQALALPPRGSSVDAATGREPTSPRQITIRRLSDAPSRITRESLNARTSRPSSKPHVAGAGPHYAVDQAAMSYGQAVRADIEQLLKWLNEQQRQHPPTLEECIALVRQLATESQFHAELKGDAERRTAVLRRIGAAEPDPKAQLPEQAEFKKLLDMLEMQRQISGLFGPDMFAPGLATWMSMLIN